MATQTLATLVIIGMISIGSLNAAAETVRAKANKSIPPLKQLERVYQKHDRKYELRASLLGMSTDELKEQLRGKSMENIVKRHGFRDMQTFYVALTGKLKEELRSRGWSEKKLDNFVAKRIARLSNSFMIQPAPAV